MVVGGLGSLTLQIAGAGITQVCLCRHVRHSPLTRQPLHGAKCPTDANSSSSSTTRTRSHFSHPPAHPPPPTPQLVQAQS